jgi:hypothetical protein
MIICITQTKIKVGKAFTICIKLDNCDIFYNMVTSLIIEIFIPVISNNGINIKNPNNKVILSAEDDDFKST